MSFSFRSSIDPVVYLLAMAVSLLVLPFGFAQQAKTFELLDGDRVVFVGNTFVERAIDYGHIEAALTTQWPDRHITFRNLGWSGDDARGRARRFFGPIEEGFQHLKTHVHELEPTVIFVAYGAMESYEGREGLPAFEKDMHTLLDMLEETGARIVLVSTKPQEKLGLPLPDPSENNANLKLYATAIESIAEKRMTWFVNLYSYLEDAFQHSESPLTDNGVHLNDEGYRAAATGILSGLGFPSVKRFVQVDAQGTRLSSSQLDVRRAQPLGDGLLLTLEYETLGRGESLTLSIPQLFDGDYTLRLNGRNLGTYSAGEWARGIQLPWTPAVDQAALLMQTILIKNEFYFHQWRPQNETYLRGFRAHEQGQNAAELEEFDALIAQEEKKIADLKRPRSYTLQLQRVMEP